VCTIIKTQCLSLTALFSPVLNSIWHLTWLSHKRQCSYFMTRVKMYKERSQTRQICINVGHSTEQSCTLLRPACSCPKPSAHYSSTLPYTAFHWALNFRSQCREHRRVHSLNIFSSLQSDLLESCYKMFMANDQLNCWIQNHMLLILPFLGYLYMAGIVRVWYFSRPSTWSPSWTAIKTTN